MEPLRIEVNKSDIAPEITVARFWGDLDTASISSLSNCFGLILEKHTPFVVAEMSEVRSISSAALGELMGGRKTLIDHGGDLALCSLSMNVKTKLTLMGANKVFRFYGDTRGAINAFKWEFEGRADHVHLSFPPQLRFVPGARQLASRLSRQKGYGRRDSFRIETIVDEICNNAVEHGVTGSDQNIQLSMIICRKKVEIKVVNVSDPDRVDSLRAFLSADREKETFAPGDARGRGLALIKLLSNELDIDFSENGTVVRAIKLKED